jgi:hypothetical protein
VSIIEKTGTIASPFYKKKDKGSLEKIKRYFTVSVMISKPFYKKHLSVDIFYESRLLRSPIVFITDFHVTGYFCIYRLGRGIRGVPIKVGNLFARSIIFCVFILSSSDSFP